ncbi:MAG: hypothetical protein ACRCUY_10765 [Thermoguttaceae bacterium]
MNAAGVQGRIPMPNKTRRLTLAARLTTADLRRRLAKTKPADLRWRLAKQPPNCG